jgi:hypothetical protein
MLEAERVEDGGFGGDGIVLEFAAAVQVGSSR